MAMAVVSTLVILFVLTLEAYGQKYDCQNLDKLNNCRNNSRLLVDKNKQDYFVRFCSGGQQCMSDLPGDMNLRIRCKDVCDVCKSLPGQNDCVEDRNCEEQVDKFLNDYCADSTRVAAQPPPAPVEILTAASNSEVTCSPVVGNGNRSGLAASRSETVEKDMPVATIGALLGLSLVLLTVVTTGWMVTCWIMKRRDSDVEMKPHVVVDCSTTNCDARYRMPPSIDKSVDEGQGEVYIRNPTYEGRSKKEKRIHEVTYDTVVELPTQTVAPGESDPTYAVPDHDKAWQGEGTYIF